MSLHPLTLKSIEAQPLLYPDDEQAAYYECRCYRHTDIWTLCDYHQGYEDAAQAMQEVVDRTQERLDEAVRLLRDARRRLLHSAHPNTPFVNVAQLDEFQGPHRRRGEGRWLTAG